MAGRVAPTRVRRLHPTGPGFRARSIKMQQEVFGTGVNLDQSLESINRATVAVPGRGQSSENVQSRHRSVVNYATAARIDEIYRTCIDRTLSLTVSTVTGCGVC